ncbi:MAG: hypothetical protein IJ220_06975 [Clostridia bacterium]|nr:hypothetical protein [Clostridia bacterium]
MINCLLFVLFFVICYLLAHEFYVNRQVNKFKKRNSVQSFAKENSFKKLFSKINFIKTKENYLFLQGYPLKLNAISYYFIKIIMAIVFGVAGIFNYHSYVIMLLLGLIGFYFLDIYIQLNKKSRDSEICSDLLTVTNSITMQLSSYVPLKDSLKNQYENCNNQDFRKAIMMFATKYELSELNIDEALNDLNSRFDILEVDMFCNTIRQYNKVGNIIELLENLSYILKEKYMNKLKSKTREKVIYITCGVILALTNIILITFYPLFISIGNNFNQIFK